MEQLKGVFNESTLAMLRAVGGDRLVRLWILTASPDTSFVLTKRTELEGQIKRAEAHIQALWEPSSSVARSPRSRELSVLQFETAIRTARERVRQLDEGELALARERDQLQATRPPGCFCLGLGGRGAPHLVMQQFVWSECCTCPDGAQQRLAAEAAWRDAERLEVEREAEEIAAENERQYQERHKAANLPPRFAGATFHTFPQERAKGAAVKRMQAFATSTTSQRGVYLFGEVGVGKTGLAAAALNAWITDGGRGLFTTVSDLLALIRSTYAPGANEQTEDVIERSRRVPLLVLDDFGTEKPTVWVREQLFRLINHRSTHNLPTIITSNHDLARAAERLATGDDPVVGARAADRILEMCDLVELRGSNLRERP